MYYKRIKIISTEKLSFNMIKLANNAFIVRLCMLCSTYKSLFTF